MSGLPYDPQTVWTYRSLESGFVKNQTLSLRWEALGDWISDDYLPGEEGASPRELLQTWLRGVWDREAFDEDLGVPYVPITWNVGDEAAPSTIPGSACENFLSYYTHPVTGEDDEPLNWLRLPVDDKLWYPEHQVDGTTVKRRADKGGFIQQATGFKPHALQCVLDIRVFDAAGVDWGDHRQQ